jgi:hypothetical protein
MDPQAHVSLGTLDLSVECECMQIAWTLTHLKVMVTWAVECGPTTPVGLLKV